LNLQSAFLMLTMKAEWQRNGLWVQMNQCITVRSTVHGAPLMRNTAVFRLKVPIANDEKIPIQSSNEMDFTHDDGRRRQCGYVCGPVRWLPSPSSLTWSIGDSGGRQALSTGGD
jgi:hypothetical protein